MRIQTRRRLATIAAIALIGNAVSLTCVTGMKAEEWEGVGKFVEKVGNYDGWGHGYIWVTHTIVGLIGILGMFSAIAATITGKFMMEEVSEDIYDDDGFSYWAKDDEFDNSPDELILFGITRERRLWVARLLCD